MPGSYSPFARRAYALPPARGYKPPTPSKGGGASLARMLFGNGEDGFLFYPPSDLTRLFTASVGPTNVAANDDPAGLWLDNHGWSGQTYAQLMAAQPELVSNGTFDTDTTGWTTLGDESLSVSSGRLRVTLGVDGLGGASGSGAYQALSGLTVGATYRLVCANRYIGTNGAVGVRVSTTAGGGTALATHYGFANASNETLFFVATATTLYLQVYGGYGTTGTYVEADGISVKAVPGRHALNATGTQRPLYKTNAPYPYLTFDGTDDRLVGPYIPNSAGGMAVAFRDNGVSATRYALAGGTSTGNKRCRIGKTSGGNIEFVFNDQFSVTSGTNYTGVDVVAAQTWGGGVRRCYLNGELFLEESRAANMDGAGSGFCLGAQEGGGSSYLSGRTYAALATSDMLTPAEIARITSDFQRTFQ